MELAQVDLSLSKVGLSCPVEVQVGLLDVAFNAKTIAIHDTEAVVGLAIALSDAALEPEERFGVVGVGSLPAKVHLAEVARR